MKTFGGTEKMPRRASVKGTQQEIPVEELTHLQTHPDLDVEKPLALLLYPPPATPFSPGLVSPILNPWLGNLLTVLTCLRDFFI